MILFQTDGDEFWVYMILQNEILRNETEPTELMH